MKADLYQKLKQHHLRPPKHVRWGLPTAQSHRQTRSKQQVKKIATFSHGNLTYSSWTTWLQRWFRLERVTAHFWRKIARSLSIGDWENKRFKRAALRDRHTNCHSSSPAIKIIHSQHSRPRVTTIRQHLLRVPKPLVAQSHRNILQFYLSIYIFNTNN